MLHTDSLQRVSETEMCPCEEKLGFLLWCFEMGCLKETSCCLVSRELRCFEDYCQLPCEQRVTVVWVWPSTIHVRVNKMYCVCIYFCWGSFDSHETLWVYVMINVWVFTGLSFKFGVSKYLTFLEHHQCGKFKFYMIVMRFNCSVQFSSVQDGMCALGKAHMPGLWEVSPMSPLKRFQCSSDWWWPKLQALVYDILPSTTAVFTHAIGSKKLSANEQIFVGAQTVVTLLQKLNLYQTFVL